MRVLTILLLLSILCLTASADEPKIIGCSCDCPGVPSAYLPEIFANGTNETNCQSACGGVCGAMSPCGFSADECSACCDTYCSGVIPHGAVQSCNGNCMQRCELNSIVGETISMLSYVAVAIAAALLAVCGIRIITSDDPDNRDAAKKCILYVLVGLLIIGLAGPVVNIFTGSKYMQARSVRLYDFNAGDDYLQISVRTLGESCTSEITWKIKASGESDFVDYSAKCLETSSQFTLAYGRSKEGIRCSSNAMPPLKKGPHVARITWCGTSREFTYPCGTYKTFTECEKRDGCWWDDHAETCNFCNAPATKIQTCTDYPTDIVKLVGEKGRCPLCTRNPCRVAEGPCYISDALFGTECKNCDGISECTDYGDSVASCECDAFACKVGTKTDHACDWSEPTDTFITVEIPEGAGAAEGGTMKLKCGDTDVSAVVMDVSGSDVRFKIAKEDMEKILDAGCWYE